MPRVAPPSQAWPRPSAAAWPRAKSGKASGRPGVQQRENESLRREEWDLRTAEITDEGGNVIFKQENVEVPTDWSQLATKVVVSKYFYGEQGTPERRLPFANSSIAWPARLPTGASGWVLHQKDGEIFYDELSWLCLNQHGAFNSPVWFNVGLHHEYGAGTSAKGNWHYNQALGQRNAPRRSTSFRRAVPVSSSRSTTTWSPSCNSLTGDVV